MGFSRAVSRVIVHFAAESHGDRSIRCSDEFIRANVCGTGAVLEEARGYWNRLRAAGRGRFRILDISTDEVEAGLRNPFSQHQFDPVIHFAGLKAVGESVAN